MLIKRPLDFTNAGTPSKGDETFVLQPGSANATYNVNQGNDTYEEPAHANETFDVINARPSQQMDGTFVMEKNSIAIVNKSNDKKGPPDTYNETLMTEYNSQDEEKSVLFMVNYEMQRFFLLFNTNFFQNFMKPKKKNLGKNKIERFFRY
jgi:hypothetical protein